MSAAVVESEQAEREAGNAELIALLRDDAAQTASNYEFDVINDPERGRWIAALGAEAVGELDYRFVGGRVVLLSTWINHAYRHQRIATELMARVLDEIRGSGHRVTIICPVIGEFIARHPRYRDLIDPVHPGSGAFPAAAAGSADDDSPDDELAAFQADVG